MKSFTLHAMSMQGTHLCITKHRDRAHEEYTNTNTYITDDYGVRLVSFNGEKIIW